MPDQGTDERESSQITFTQIWVKGVGILPIPERMKKNNERRQI